MSIIVLISMAASKPVADDNKIYSMTSNFDDGNAIAGGSDGDDDDGGDGNGYHGDGGDSVNNSDGVGIFSGSGDDDVKNAIIAMAGIFISGK